MHYHHTYCFDSEALLVGMVVQHTNTGKYLNHARGSLAMSLDELMEFGKQAAIDQSLEDEVNTAAAYICEKSLRSEEFGQGYIVLLVGSGCH